MRRILVLSACGIALSMIAIAQDNEPKPILSRDPLTKEQIAVYRAVLEDYVKGTDGALNIANQTEPLGLSEPFSPNDCIRSSQLEPAPKPGPVVHRLDRAVALSAKMVLVDRDEQERIVNENDPSNLIQRVIDKHEPVSENQIDKAVDKAFQTGLFTFSEIAFDKQHRRAVLTYSFTCGGLCGHGNMVVVGKVRGRWKMIKKCGGWIS